MQLYAMGKLFGGIICHWRLQRHQIGFLTMVTRRGDAMRPLSVIGHQHQSSGVDIQTPCRMQFVGNRFIKEIESTVG